MPSGLNSYSQECGQSYFFKNKSWQVILVLALFEKQDKKLYKKKY